MSTDAQDADTVWVVDHGNDQGYHSHEGVCPTRDAALDLVADLVPDDHDVDDDGSGAIVEYGPIADTKGEWIVRADPVEIAADDELAWTCQNCLAEITADQASCGDCGFQPQRLAPFLGVQG